MNAGQSTTDVAARAVGTPEGVNQKGHQMTRENTVNVPREPTEAMLAASTESLIEQYDANGNWDDAKDVIEKLDTGAIYRAMLSAAPLHEGEGEDWSELEDSETDRLHKAIGRFRAHVVALQKGKTLVAAGKPAPSPSPIYELFAALPSLLREFEMAEFDIEAAFERYEDRRAVPMEAVSRAYCQKCGGNVEGWICQSCDQDFRENDAGDLVFDDDAASPPMEAVAWREKVARLIDPAAFLFGPDELDEKVYSASRAHAFDRADAILQALALIPQAEDQAPDTVSTNEVRDE